MASRLLNAAFHFATFLKHHSVGLQQSTEGHTSHRILNRLRRGIGACSHSATVGFQSLPAVAVELGLSA